MNDINEALVGFDLGDAATGDAITRKSRGQRSPGRTECDEERGQKRRTNP